jgi:hypothetical protein
MSIVEFVSLEVALRAIVVAWITLIVLKRAGAIHSYLHPLTPALFQSALTVGLLGFVSIPASHVACLVLLFALLCREAPRPRPPSLAQDSAWRRSIPFFVVFSLAVNAYLVANKGFLLLADDVGKARVEFYQGWGLFQRCNTVCSIILGAHWAAEFLKGKWLKPKNLLLLLWIVYLTLTLGSKAGLLSLLTLIGAATFFSDREVKSSHLIVPIIAVTVSVAGMFFLFYGVDALVGFFTRFVSYADGPFYYFGFDRPLHVSLSYPFQQLLVALRVIPKLPESSLGPAINLEQFDFDSELFGPNPQIFVESVAILGPLYPLYYLLIGILMLYMLRSARSVYSLALISSVVGPLIIDSQLAFSNLFNVMLGLALRFIGSRIGSRTHATKPPVSHLPRIQ